MIETDAYHIKDVRTVRNRTRFVRFRTVLYIFFISEISYLTDNRIFIFLAWLLC